MRRGGWGLLLVVPGLVLMALGALLAPPWAPGRPDWVLDLTTMSPGVRELSIVLSVAGLLAASAGAVPLLMRGGTPTVGLLALVTLIQLSAVVAFGMSTVDTEDWPGLLEDVPVPPSLAFVVLELTALAVTGMAVAIGRYRPRPTDTDAEEAEAGMFQWLVSRPFGPQEPAPAGSRPGVLITIVVAGLLLSGSAITAWWPGQDAVLPGPAGFGLVFLGCAAVALVAFAVAVLPVPGRVVPVAVRTGLGATATAAIAWAVLLTQVFERDAAAHRAWAPEVWEWQAYAATGAEGANLGLAAVVLLLVIGAVLAVPQRHERTVLLLAAAAVTAGALLLTVPVWWETTGPATVEAHRVWLPGWYADATPTVVTLLILLVLLVAGLTRRWRTGLGLLTACYCYAAFFWMGADLADGLPLGTGHRGDAGAGVVVLLPMALFVPQAVVFRVLCADVRHTPAP
ncbi:hypothetical protein [Catenuloplanes japonicus]|uniref:hypothetical protein n=1 Tax=Catenuloplanes japonicus TaxID=33876 RepID=UPI0005276730|nr:hypothetical protein [Catenuloplanes japonicus]